MARWDHHGTTDGPRGTVDSAVDGLGGPPAVAKDIPGGPIMGGGNIHSVTGHRSSNASQPITAPTASN